MLKVLSALLLISSVAFADTNISEMKKYVGTYDRVGGNCDSFKSIAVSVDSPKIIFDATTQDSGGWKQTTISDDTDWAFGDFPMFGLISYSRTRFNCVGERGACALWTETKDCKAFANNDCSQPEVNKSDVMKFHGKVLQFRRYMSYDDAGELCTFVKRAPR